MQFMKRLAETYIMRECSEWNEIFCHIIYYHNADVMVTAISVMKLPFNL
jgi:hypothetical protein